MAKRIAPSDNYIISYIVRATKYFIWLHPKQQGAIGASVFVKGCMFALGACAARINTVDVAPATERAIFRPDHHIVIVAHVIYWWARGE